MTDDVMSGPAYQAEIDLQAMACDAAAMTGLGYWYFSAVTGGLSWSDEVYAIYGLDRARHPPSVSIMMEACHPDDRERLMAHRQEVQGKDAEIEIRIVRPDGDIRHVVARSTVKPDVDGEPTGRFGTFQDITEIRRTEAAARESEARYRFLAEHAPDMITRITPEGQIKYISPSCERVFGYAPEEHVKLTPMEMSHPEDLPMVAEAIMGMVERRQTRLAEPIVYRGKHKDGSWIWVEANPILILDDNGEPLEFVDIVRDVTPAKLAEAELREARREAEAAAAAKASFLANMSHELRTPLTSIIGFSHLLGDRDDLPDQAGHYVRRISDASGALLTLINDVLDFSKLEAGQVELETQSFSVEKLAQEALGLMSIQASAKGVDLRLQLDGFTPEAVDGDVARLRQVMLNLLSNAVKFTPKGLVTIRTRWRQGATRQWLRVAIADTGAGIAPESRRRLFERFSQADVSINRTHGGTGLGLAICKGIIELMGGRIGLASAVGSGSVFWFEVPLSPSHAAIVEAQPEIAADCPSLRLLVVDDTAMNRELVRLMLGPLGLEIEEADGGAEGVKAAMTRAFDVILMDVRMPGIDGLEATRVIRAASELNRRTPILALTADVQPENAQACREAGMDDVLAKPIVPRQLIERIMRWAGGRDEEPLAATG